MSEIKLLTSERELYIRNMLANREYCGAANDAIPMLLIEIERLRVENARLRRWLEHIAMSGNVHSSWLVSDAKKALAGESFGEMPARTSPAP